MAIEKSENENRSHEIRVGATASGHEYHYVQIVSTKKRERGNVRPLKKKRTAR